MTKKSSKTILRKHFLVKRNTYLSFIKVQTFVSAVSKSNYNTEYANIQQFLYISPTMYNYYPKLTTTQKTLILTDKRD